MKKPLVICGPTASGKTALAIALAKMLDGEIVSADSMQIYRGMDIGTAKPTVAERAEAVHHMIDVAEPGESFSAARYSEMAGKITDDILNRGKTPIICGGTGLYINALISGTQFAQNGIDNGLRDKIIDEADEKGWEYMLEKLRQIDPELAGKLHLKDTKRITRGLEIFYATGKTQTEHNRESKLVPPRYDAVFIGIKPEDRAVLYDRINKRVDLMIRQGLISEVKGLMDTGRLKGTAAQAIGYKEMSGHLRGEMTLLEATELIKQKSRNYAKRQLTWFNADERVHFLTYGEKCEIDSLCQKATKFL